MLQQHAHTNNTLGEWQGLTKVSSVCTMSKLSFAPIFSAAHVSKWDPIPEDARIRATQSGFGLETWVSGQSNDAGHDACAPSELPKSNGGVLSTRECEITVRVDGPVAAPCFVGPRSIRSCGTYNFTFFFSFWVPTATVSSLSFCASLRTDLVTLFASCFNPFLCESDNMSVKTYTWITFWFLLTAPVVLWDATYCFMRYVGCVICAVSSQPTERLRPRSMVGGDLHWIWEPYGLYQNVDYVSPPSRT